MITIKQGSFNDISFLVNAIIEAEKSGTSILSYSKIFELREEETAHILTQILEEDIAGSELCPSAFQIAFDESLPVGCVAGWIEGIEGISSNMIKANSLYFFLDKGKIGIYQANVKVVETLDIPREQGALQLESVYVDPKYRGKGISGNLIFRHIENHKTSSPLLKKAQIQVMAENENALAAYLKTGFEIKLKKQSDNPMITNFLPANTRILMEKTI